ncbi:MAG: AI-2E family transporter [Gemmatimonadaceae bacterium]
MKFLHDKQSRAAILIILLGIGITIALSPFAVGLLGATVLYVICVPLQRRLQRVMKPDLAAAVTLMAALLCIAVPLTWIVALIADQLPDTIRSAQQSQIFSQIATLRIGRMQVGPEVAKASGSVLQWLSEQALNFVSGAAKATLNLVISLFALYYMLISSDSMWRVFRGVLPFSADTAEELRTRFYSVTHATLLGTALTGLLQGGLIGVGFLIVGLPNPAFWGVVTGFASILPVLGSALVWLPGSIVLFFEHRYGAAVTLLVIGGVLASNIDNVIRPLVFRRVSNIHPLITLVGAFAGVSYFGLLGVLLGPLAIQYFFVLVRLYREEYVDRRVMRTSEMRIPVSVADPTSPHPMPAIQAPTPPRAREAVTNGGSEGV